MPMYVVTCTCGFFDDEFMATLKQREAPMICPDCGQKELKFVPCPVRPIGVIFSNATDLSTQFGRKFETNAELREFEKTNDIHLVSTSSSEWRGQLDSARARADAMAKKQGFKDSADKRAEMARRKKEKA